MTTTAASAKSALFAKTSTDALVLAAHTLDAITSPTPEQRMAAAWTSDEIEQRMGGIPDDDAFDALLDQGLTYTAALIATFPALSV